MRIFNLLLVLWHLAQTGYGQKLFLVPKITTPFSGISYTKGHNRQEFKPSVARINFSWGVDIFYQRKLSIHRISVEEVPFGYYFKIVNKFMLPPNAEQLLGHVESKNGAFIDHFVLSYALQKEGKKPKGFLFRSKIKFNYSAGAGISFNRSRTYWDTRFSASSVGWSNPYTYIAYDAVHYRDGFGLFVRGTGGFDFVSKRGYKKLSVNIFYNQGIKDMAHFDIHYRYGYWNDPSKRVDVPHQILRSRGTTFGFSIGVPIIIIK